MYGNDTIDPYPLYYEGELKKILCIRKELFEKLKADWNKFRPNPKLKTTTPKTPLEKKSFEKRLLEKPKNNDFKLARDKCIDYFEPSNIFNIQNSYFWSSKNGDVSIF